MGLVIVGGDDSGVGDWGVLIVVVIYRWGLVTVGGDDSWGW